MLFFFLLFFFLLLLFSETAQLTQLVCCAWNAFLEAFTESTDTGLVILQDNDIVISDSVCVRNSFKFKNVYSISKC